MRELTLDEIEQVSGGSGIGEYAADRHVDAGSQLF